MCKVGVSKWTKSQSTAKKAEVELLDRVADGSLAIEDIKTAKDDIETRRLMIDETDMPQGYKSEEEAKDAINNEL